MNISGYWCSLILLTFTIQDILGSHYQKLQLNMPKEYLRHQRNYNHSSFVDGKLVEPTEFLAEQTRMTRNKPAEIRSTEIRSFRSSISGIHSAKETRATDFRQMGKNHHAEIHSTRNRASMEFRPTEIHSSRPGIRSTEIHHTENNRRVEIRPVENRAMTIDSMEILPATNYLVKFVSRQNRATGEFHSSQEQSTEYSHLNKVRSQEDITANISPTEIRPVEIFWTEIELPETNIERSQIRHGRSRGHFTRQRIEEDSSKHSLPDVGVSRFFDRIKTNVRENREYRSGIYQAERRNDFQEESTILPKHNYPLVVERNSSGDNSITLSSYDQIKDTVSKELERSSKSKLYQEKKEHLPQESFIIPLTHNNSSLIKERSSSKQDNSIINRSFDQIKKEKPDNSLEIRHTENHGILRSSSDLLKDSYKNDPLSKLRKAISLDKTLSITTIDRNTSDINIIDSVENTSSESRDLDEEVLQDVILDYTNYEETVNVSDGTRRRPEAAQVDIVTRFLRIIENQHTLGENCTAGTDLNLGEGVVDQYAQEKFRLEANFAVNRANMLTRLWKYAPEVMLSSEYLLHASVLSMVEFDEDIFAAGNCYDKLQYKDRWLYCPFAHRLPNQDGILVKDLAIQYKYLSNSSEWFYIARKNAERVIASYEQFSRGELLLVDINFITLLIHQTFSAIAHRKY